MAVALLLGGVRRARRVEVKEKFGTRLMHPEYCYLAKVDRGIGC
jgi:hypothetical protein